MKIARYTKTFALVSGLLLLTSCSTPSPGKRMARFTEGESADFIARYYSNQTSYMVRPVVMEGPYQSICDRALLLKLAREQPRHELAVIVLLHYWNEASEESVKSAWVNDLKGLGYQRIVFLRGGNRMQVNGLAMLESPQASAAFAGK